jgi:hypothetical protein
MGRRASGRHRGETELVRQGRLRHSGTRVGECSRIPPTADSPRKHTPIAVAMPDANPR